MGLIYWSLLFLQEADITKALGKFILKYKNLSYLSGKIAEQGGTFYYSILTNQVVLILPDGAFNFDVINEAFSTARDDVLQAEHHVEINLRAHREVYLSNLTSTEVGRILNEHIKTLRYVFNAEINYQKYAFPKSNDFTILQSQIPFVSQDL